MRILAVFDSKAQIFAPPFLAHSVDEAKRMLIATMSDKSTVLAQFPGDFDLYDLGSWDEHGITGSVMSPLSPSDAVRVGCVLEFIKE